jgi:glycosyltransferase involved in cell wall biosynthesis
MSGAANNSRSLNILALVSDAFGGHGGIALYMRDVLRCLATRNDNPRIRLIARGGKSEGVDLPANIQWERRALKGKLAFIWAVVLALLSRSRPSLILCGHVNLLPVAWLASQLTGSPMVLFVYGIDVWKPPRGFLIRRLISPVDLIVSISEVTRQRFLSWSGVSATKVVLMPNAIKLERYGEGPKSTALLARYAIENKTVLMTLGRLSSVQRHKGVDEVIEALPRLLPEFPDLVYLVGGAGDDIPRLRVKAEQCRVSDRVVFTGMVPESEKADHYRLADAFALTGRGDGFGFVLLEAMACGIPAVASVLDGSQEAVLNGEIGELVNPDSVDSLVSGLSNALKKPKGIPAKLSYFSYEKFCVRLNAAIEPLVKAAA